MVNNKAKEPAINTEFLIDILTDIIGGLLIAIGTYNIAAAAMLPMSGVNGIALIFYHLLNLPIGAMAIAFNIPIILCTFGILGKSFFLKSIKSMIITSIIMDVVAPMFPIYNGDRMLACIISGVLSGLGFALIYMRDSSTGGVDFIIMAIKSKKPHITVGKISFVIDAAIVLLGAAVVNKDVDSLLYGIINAYIVSLVLDKVMYGADSGKVALIVTDKGREVCNKIDEVYDRGTTILNARGGYTGHQRDVVMCACNNKQMYGIRRLIKQVDPTAFFVIVESSDVIGEGFKDK